MFADGPIARPINSKAASEERLANLQGLLTQRFADIAELAKAAPPEVQQAIQGKLVAMELLFEAILLEKETPPAPK